MNEFLTVKEYAAARGVSKQFVYAEISKGSLETTVKKINGRTQKVIIVGNSTNSTDFSTNSTNSSSNSIDNSTAFSTNSIDFLQEEIKYLREKLDEKEQRIADLTDNITALSQRIADITEQNNVIAIQTVQKLTDTENGTDTATALEVREKQNFFARLFKRK